MNPLEGAPDQAVDARGRTAAEALIATRDGLRLLRDGALLEVIVDDPTMAEDTIASYCEKRRHPYEVRRADGKSFTIRIRKAG